MLRDHTGAPRSLPVYLALVWFPVLSTLLFGQISTTLFASVLAALVIAVVAHDGNAGACASVAIVRDDGDHQRGEDRREECRRDLAEQQR